MINVLKCHVHIGNKLCITQGNKHLGDWLKVTGGVGGCISHHDFLGRSYHADVRALQCHPTAPCLIFLREQSASKLPRAWCHTSF